MPSSNEKATNPKPAQQPKEAPVKLIDTPDERKTGLFSEVEKVVPKEKD